MAAIVVVSECEMIIIWIIAAYIQLEIFLLRVRNSGIVAGCVMCLGFAVKTP